MTRRTIRWTLLAFPAALGGCDLAAEAPSSLPPLAPSACAPRDAALPTAEALLAAGVDLGWRPREPDPDEADQGLPFEDPGPTPPAQALAVEVPRPNPLANGADADGDCLPDAQEAAAGTSASKPDTDGDGWFDGPCNERRRLVVVSVKAWDESEDLGVDETYLVVDDRRFPTSDDLDGFWDFDDGQSRTLNLTLATRVRGTNATGSLSTARLEGWDDDVELTNTWGPDDLLFATTVNLGAQTPGASFKVRRTGPSSDYELTLRVDVERFADPRPTFDSDSDLDGISESREFAVSRDLGGIADPARKDVLVELDAMPGRGLQTRARRLVVTRLAAEGLALQVRGGETLPEDDCLRREEVYDLYMARFQLRSYRAFRYAVMANVLWNDASGVALADTFLVDDSTWWIDGGVLPQAGTFLHELGHTMSLTQDLFRLIDTTAGPGYDSAMNYFYQPSKVDFSHDGKGGSSGDHDDWAAVKPAYGLRTQLSLYGRTVDGGACEGLRR
jgi:hypothetical protein